MIAAIRFLSGNRVDEPQYRHFPFHRRRNLFALGKHGKTRAAFPAGQRRGDA
jgi:hypothetical protein